MARIFQHLQGNYGSRFLNMWKVGQQLPDGSDIGIENAKRMWGERLAAYEDHPECIKYVLDHLPPDPPTLPEFAAMLNNAPRKESPMLPYKPTEEDQRRAQEAIATASATLKRKTRDGIDEHWATHPRSERQLRAIFEAAANDLRFKPCIARMVSDGICTTDGRLLKRYANTGTWEKM